MTESGSAAPAWYRVAAELRWANPALSWAEIGARCNRSESTLHRARKTEAWEIVFRETGGAYIDKLAPAAVHALVRQWAKGNAAGAIDVLRSFGFLKPERQEITGAGGTPLVPSDPAIESKIDAWLLGQK